MTKANMKFDLEWTVRLLNELESYLKQDQKMMARGTVQRVRETLETYGRTGNELLFGRILDIEQNIGRGDRSLLLTEELKNEMQSVLNNLK
ncbi:MAG: hypothetical protein Q8R18_01470 [bacterium]|nr:hypothetical protein [bacterium]